MKRYGLRGYSLMKSSSNSCSFRELFLNFAPITINAITTAISNMLPKVIRFHLLSHFLVFDILHLPVYIFLKSHAKLET